MTRWLACIALVLVAGCPRGGGRTTPGPGAAALTIPPTDATGPALAGLAERAGAGDVDAAWTRAHYLLDLFDHARYSGDDASRAALWQFLGGAGEHATRGPEATDRAVAAVAGEVDRVHAHDPLHRGAAAARTLLRLDASRPSNLDQLLRATIELKAAGRVDAVAGNAVLRLAGHCLRALGDATRGPMRRRATALSHCLYPLYDADPAPYFAAPAERPPLPDWRLLADGLDRLLAAGAADAPRLRPTFAAMQASLAELRRDRADRLPAEPDVRALELPVVDHAATYDWTPIAPAGGAEADPLEGDGRGVVALALPASAPVAELRRQLAAAERAGADAVDLVVGFRQQLAVPEGDYRAVVGADTNPLRAGAVRVALDTTGRGDDTPVIGPGDRAWERGRAELALHLVVTPSHWRLVSPTGAVGEIRRDRDKSDPRTELRVTLARIRAAFPDEAGLRIVAADGVTYGDVVETAAAAARDARGRTLFRYLAFADAAPEPKSDRLATRIERRWRAVVEVTPDLLAAREAPIRRCYMTLLEDRPGLGGTIALARAGGEIELSGAESAPLRGCVRDALAAAMRERSVAQAKVRLAPN